MRKILQSLIIICTFVLTLAACGRATNKIIETAEAKTESAETKTETEGTATETDETLRLYIDGTEVPVTWENNASADALKQLAGDGLTVELSMYGGFEQVGSLGKTLPKNDRQTTTEAGDVVLYSGDQLVIFYGSNSWSYTRLGHIGLSAGEMAGLLSRGNVTVTLKYE